MTPACWPLHHSAILGRSARLELASPWFTAKGFHQLSEDRHCSFKPAHPMATFRIQSWPPMVKASCPLTRPCNYWSGWQDLNLRHLASKARTLTRLSYTQIDVSLIADGASALPLLLNGGGWPAAGDAASRLLVTLTAYDPVTSPSSGVRPTAELQGIQLAGRKGLEPSPT